MPQAPHDITVSPIDATVTRAAWTDPNPNTQTVRFWTAPTGGTERHFTTAVCRAYIPAVYCAYIPAGTYWLELKDTNGQVSPRIQITSTPSEPALPPPPPPPPTLSTLDHLQAALGIQPLNGDTLYIRILKDDQLHDP